MCFGGPNFEDKKREREIYFSCEKRRVREEIAKDGECKRRRQRRTAHWGEYLTNSRLTNFLPLSLSSSSSFFFFLLFDSLTPSDLVLTFFLSLFFFFFFV